MLNPTVNAHVLPLNDEERNEIFEAGQKIITSWTRPLIFDNMVESVFPAMLNAEYKSVELRKLCRTFGVDARRATKSEMCQMIARRIKSELQS